MLFYFIILFSVLFKRSYYVVVYKFMRFDRDASLLRVPSASDIDSSSVEGHLKDGPTAISIGLAYYRWKKRACQKHL